jgi:hypothetical protein
MAWRAAETAAATKMVLFAWRQVGVQKIVQVAKKKKSDLLFVFRL